MTENVHIPLFRKLIGDYKLLYISGHFRAIYIFIYIEMAFGRIYILKDQRKNVNTVNYTKYTVVRLKLQKYAFRIRKKKVEPKML